mmetsp:Transcript_7047/g.17151  ORF Transcript_7047/g.17151 Transcript_7047/m.17151 type:complete len:196 (-) Transcript_7047:1687-2274(-)
MHARTSRVGPSPSILPSIGRPVCAQECCAHPSDRQTDRQTETETEMGGPSVVRISLSLSMYRTDVWYTHTSPHVTPHTSVTPQQSIESKMSRGVTTDRCGRQSARRAQPDTHTTPHTTRHPHDPSPLLPSLPPYISLSLSADGDKSSFSPSMHERIAFTSLTASVRSLDHLSIYLSSFIPDGPCLCVRVILGAPV